MSHNTERKTNWQPYDGYLTRQMQLAKSRKENWLLAKLKGSVPNRLYGTYVTDEGEAV